MARAGRTSEADLRSGDLRRLQRLVREIKDLGTPGGRAQGEILTRVGVELKALLREEFAEGIDPEGAPWQRTKRGKQPLRSFKIPSSIRVYPYRVGVLVSSRISWLATHGTGWVFAARSAGGQWLRYNGKRRLVSARRFERLKRGRAVQAKVHLVGRRVLPARPAYPTSSSAIPSRWADRINRAAAAGVRAWYERATR